MSSPSALVDAPSGVTVAVHELGGTGPVLLVAHATGFCARVYRALGEELADRCRVVGIDLRGHGHTEPAPDGDTRWSTFGGDVLAVVDELGVDEVHGFGHSMGCVALLFAELDRPDTFRSLFLHEPIVFPDALPPPDPNPLALGARRRRADFGSAAEAIANFAEKPPMNRLRADVLADYVAHGFVESDDGSVTLRCTPEVEARTYEGDRDSRSRTFAGLAVGTTVSVGRIEGERSPQPPTWAPELVARMADAQLLDLSPLGHFAPLEHPPTVAAAVRAHLDARR